MHGAETGTRRPAPWRQRARISGSGPSSFDRGWRRREQMSADPRAVVQGAALVASQRGLQTLAGLCFAAVVPRLMGPDRFGRYAVMTSLALLFAVTSGIALTNATTRYMPSLADRGEPALLRRLVGNLFALRVASGAVAAGAYLLVTILWWTDLDPAVLAAMAASVWANGVATFMFAL